MEERKTEIWQRSKVRAALYFGLLTVIFFSPVFFGGKVFVNADFLYRTPLWYNQQIPLQNFDLFDSVIFWYPDADYLNQSLKEGEFPYWSPYNLGGRPVAFNGSCGYFYPPRIVFNLLFSTQGALMALLSTHLFLSGFCLYLYCRRVGMSHLGGIVSGTSWMFNGIAMGWFEMELGPVFSALVAMALLAGDWALDSFKGTAALAVVSGCIVVAGMLQFSYYCLFITIALGLYRWFQHKKRWPSFWRVTLGFVCGPLLAAPGLVPTVVNLTGSQRPTLTITYLTTTFREFLYDGWLTFFFPDLLGNPADDFAFSRIPSGGYFIYSELSAYAGAAAILLFMAGIWKKGFPRYIGGLALATLLVPATPLYALVHWLPGLNRINSTRVIFVWMMCVAMGAGFGMEALTRRTRGILTGVSLAFATGWLGFLAWMNSAPAPQTVAKWLNQGRLRLPTSELYLSKEEFFRAAIEGFERVYGWGSFTAWSPILWLVLFALCMAWPKRGKMLLIGVLAADMLVFGLRFQAIVPSNWVYPTTKTIRFLQDTTKFDRVLGVASIKPNTLKPFKINDLAGYEAAYPRPAGMYLNHLLRGKYDPDRALTAQVFPIRDYQSPLVDLGGARYLVAYPGQELDGKNLIHKGELWVYENPSAYPRAFLVDDYEVETDIVKSLDRMAAREVNPREVAVLTKEPQMNLARSKTSPGEARIVSYAPHHVEIELESKDSALLILTDSFAEGWSAQLDGQEVEIYQVDVMFRAVEVKEGKHRVTFTYRPPHFVLSWSVCVGTTLLLFGLVLYQRRLDVQRLDQREQGGDGHAAHEQPSEDE